MKIYQIIVSVVISLTISACGNTTNDINTIELRSQEIVNENEDMSKLSTDFLGSEYIEFEYSGDKHFDLVLEVWENGEVIGSIQELNNIEGSTIKAISIVINPYSEEGYNTIIGIELNEGYESSKFAVEKPIKELAGRVESKMTKTQFSDSEEIVLWGFHCFDKDFQPFEGSLEAAKEMEWSVVAVLKPLD